MSIKASNEATKIPNQPSPWHFLLCSETKICINSSNLLKFITKDLSMAVNREMATFQRITILNDSKHILWHHHSHSYILLLLILAIVSADQRFGADKFHPPLLLLPHHSLKYWSLPFQIHLNPVLSECGGEIYCSELQFGSNLVQCSSMHKAPPGDGRSTQDFLRHNFIFLPQHNFIFLHLNIVRVHYISYQKFYISPPARIIPHTKIMYFDIILETGLLYF